MKQSAISTVDVQFFPKIVDLFTKPELSLLCHFKFSHMTISD